MKNIRFQGIMPALITPYDENGRVKKNTVKELVDWHLKAGVTGFYICGATGEGPILPKETRMEMTEICVDAVAGRGDVIAHVGAFYTKDAIEMTKHATKTGVDGIASLAPNFYFKHSIDEIVDYYKTIAGNTNLPTMMYATKMLSPDGQLELLEKMMKIENVVGLKDTRSDYYAMWQAKQINDGDINIINGPDEMLICGLSMGANGGIGSTYNIMPDKFVAIYDRFMAGDIIGTQVAQTKVNRIIGVLKKYDVINSIKNTLQIKGYDVGNAAYPKHVFSQKERTALIHDLRDAGYEI